MSEQTKIDIAEAAAFAMIPIVITSMLLVESFMIPSMLRDLDFVSAALLASFFTSILMGVGYFAFKTLISVANDIWRSKQ